MKRYIFSVMCIEHCTNYFLKYIIYYINKNKEQNKFEDCER